MLSRFNQLKQSLSEELTKDKNDPINVLERNSQVLKSDTPSAQQMDFMSDQPAEKDDAQDGESKESTPTQDEEYAAKMRKFAKYEEKYPLLLKAYRLEKKKAELVKLFEQVLGEHTPVSSIAEPKALVEYLDGLDQRTKLMKEELERVSDAHSRLRKRNIAAAQELEKAKEELKQKDEEIRSLKEASPQDPSEEAQQEAANTQSALKQSQEELEACKGELEKARDELDKSQQDLKASNEEIEKYKAELAEHSKVSDHVAALEKELESTKKLLEEKQLELAKKQAEETASKSAIPLNSQTQTGTASKKNKKGRKNRKADANAQSTSQSDTVPETVADASNLEQEIAQLKATIIEKEERISQLESELRDTSSKLEEQTKALDARDKDLASYVEDAKRSESSIQDLEQKLEHYSTELEESSKKLKDTERKLADASSKSTEMAALHMKNGDLDREVQRLQKQLEAEQASHKSVLKEASELKPMLEEAVKKAEIEQKRRQDSENSLKLFKDKSDKSAKVLQSEKSELQSKLRELENRISSTESSAASAKLSQETMNRQLEETRLRASEANAQIELMRDELAESQRVAQERLQELIMARALVNERQADKENSLVEAQRTITILKEERDQLELESESLSKRLVRETETLRQECNDLRQRLETCSKNCKTYEDDLLNVRREYRELQKSSYVTPEPAAPAPNEGELRDLRLKLEQAEMTAREATRANAVLKKVSDDAQERLNRLQKAHRTLADDLEHAKAQTAAQKTSAPSPQATNEEQQAYIRNVLLGFLEHREQRKQLMPVISTLLKFEPGDEQRLLGALK